MAEEREVNSALYRLDVLTELCHHLGLISTLSDEDSNTLGPQVHTTLYLRQLECDLISSWWLQAHWDPRVYFKCNTQRSSLIPPAASTNVSLHHCNTLESGHMFSSQKKRNVTSIF